jgi:2-polyprenyl-6-methoxyphenol hydroxylase-like FAD-dependent oxidoreductase
MTDVAIIGAGMAGAMHSGIAAANQINSQLHQRVFSESNFLNFVGNNS